MTARARLRDSLALALALTSTTAAASPASLARPAEAPAASSEPSGPRSELAPPTAEEALEPVDAPAEESAPADIDGPEVEAVTYEDEDESDVEFRALPTLRIGAGPLFSLSPKRPAAVAFEVSLGAQLTLARYDRDVSFFIHPALGYAHDGPGPHVRNAFSSGLGLGLGSDALIAYYRARYLVGSSGGALTHGVRHGLSVEVLLGAASIELDHDWRVEGDGQRVHGLALLLSVDLLLLSLGAWLLISLSR